MRRGSQLATLFFSVATALGTQLSLCDAIIASKPRLKSSPMQPLRPLLLLAVLAGARANCVDPGSVSPADVGTKYCCPGIASELKTGQAALQCWRRNKKTSR